MSGLPRGWIPLFVSLPRLTLQSFTEIRTIFSSFRYFILVSVGILKRSNGWRYRWKARWKFREIPFAKRFDAVQVRYSQVNAFVRGANSKSSHSAGLRRGRDRRFTHIRWVTCNRVSTTGSTKRLFVYCPCWIYLAWQVGAGPDPS